MLCGGACTIVLDLGHWAGHIGEARQRSGWIYEEVIDRLTRTHLKTPSRTLASTQSAPLVSDSAKTP